MSRSLPALAVAASVVLPLAALAQGNAEPEELKVSLSGLNPKGSLTTTLGRQ